MLKVTFSELFVMTVSLSFSILTQWDIFLCLLDSKCAIVSKLPLVEMTVFRCFFLLPQLLATE
jgi:hypothetical protein